MIRPFFIELARVVQDLWSFIERRLHIDLFSIGQKMNIIDFARCFFLLTDKAAVFLENAQTRQTATPLKSFDVALAIRLID